MEDTSNLTRKTIPEAWFDLFVKLDQITSAAYKRHSILDVEFRWVPQPITWESPYKEVYQRDKPEGQTVYKDTYRHLLRFVRNFQLHALRHIKVCVLYTAYEKFLTALSVLTLPSTGAANDPPNWR